MPRTDTRAGRSVATSGDMLVLSLYVAGDGPNSALAEANLRALLREREEGSYRLQIVDCIQDPMRALGDGVIVTPTLKKVAPAPPQTIVGALSDTARVRAALGLADDDRG